MAPVGIVALIMAPIIGRNLGRINLRLAPTIAFVVFGITLFWFASQTEQASFGQLAMPRFVMGLGVSLFFLPLNQIIMSGIPASELASAAGLSNFVRTISGSISTAACIFVWNDRSEYHYATLVEHVAIDAPAWIDYQAQLAQQGITGTSALATTANMISGQATTLGANDVFFGLAFLFVALVPFVWLAKPPFRAAGTGSSH
jgi:DHA2 family multidrug resistance protein